MRPLTVVVCALGACVVRAHAAQPELLLLTGDIIPGTGGLSVGSAMGTAMINAAGDVAVSAPVGGVGSVLSYNGVWRRVAFNGMAAPQSPGMTFDGIATGNLHLDDHSNTSFSSTLTGGSFLALGVFAESGGALTVAARDAAVAPCSPPGTYIMSGSIPMNTSNNGHLAFACRFDATGTGLTYGAIFSGQMGSIGQHARQDAPPSGSGFTTLGGPIVNSTGGIAAFAGFLGPTQRTGIFVGPSGGLLAAATSDSPAPDADGNPLPGDVRFTTFFSFDLNIANAVAFIATIKNSVSGQGVWVKDAMGQRLIAIDKTPVPGIPGAIYGAFSGPVLCDNGDVFFISSLSGTGITSNNSRTLFRCRGKTISVVARDGDPCPGIPGATYSWNTAFTANAAGQAALTGITSPGGESIILRVQPNNQLTLAHRETTNLTFRGNLIRRVASFSTLWFAGGNDGIQRSLNNNAQLAVTCSVNIAPGQPFGPNGKGVVVFPLGTWCPADLNADGFVDDADFSVFAAAYNILDCADPMMAAGCPADLNLDGFVDDPDFSLFAVAYDVLLCP